MCGTDLEKTIYEQYSSKICINTDDENKHNANLALNYFYLFGKLGIELNAIKDFVLNGIRFCGKMED